MKGKKRERMAMLVGVIGFFFCLILFSGSADGAIPQQINYQGYLANVAGVPVSGTLQMIFSIYNVPSGGSPLWTETQSVTVDQGVYSVNLGDVTPITLPFDTQYYLGVIVGTDPEMTPRILLTSVGYAFRAQTVETIGSHQHSGGDITAGTVAEAWIDSLIARDAEVTSAISTHTANPSAHHTRYTNAEAVAAIKAADGSGSGLDADLLDGLDSSAYVNVAGDTMTGSLNLPANGLVAGTNQLVLSGGNVGIGLTSPTQKLEVSGNVKISGTGNGLAFPDGTTQTTAVTGGGGGVPAGFMILGDTSTSPAGYTYTGKTIGMPGSWATKANMPTGRHSLAAAVVNNKVYVIGGRIDGSTAVATNEEYDPATNTWSPKANMPTAREGLATSVVNNKIYAIGGYFVSTPLFATNEEYDPVTNAWTPKANMPTARGCIAAAAANNKIYVIGNCGGQPSSTINEEYDPTVNTWSTKAPMPTAREWVSAAAVNNKIYVIGGNIGSPGTGVLATNEEYDPANNTWARKASMHTARETLAVAVTNNRVYAIGGAAGVTAVVATNEEYDPSTDTWIGKAGMPTARILHAAASVGNEVYVIGGSGWPILTFTATNEEFTPEFLYVHKKD